LNPRAGSSRRFAPAILAFCCAAVLFVPQPRAHEFSVTEVLVLLKSDGTYQVDMTVDADALALGVSPEIDSAELAAQLESLSVAEFEGCVERAAETVRRRARIRFDGERVLPEVSFPWMGTPLADEAELPTVLGTLIRLSGAVPDGAEELTFGASRSFRAVHLTILDQTSLGGIRTLLEPGADSAPYRLGQPVAPPSRALVVADYLVLGFEHILPRGIDHILFVLGLFLLSTRMRPLLWQITAFTVAHSVTLALSMYGLASLPSRLVESLIALSIAYVAFENVITSELKPWRPLLVFGFGLLHGLGFADALRELGLPRDEFATALVAFNVGVELGQLAVVALAFLTLGWARKRPWYRARVVIPLSTAIALIGLYWAITRGLGIG